MHRMTGIISSYPISSLAKVHRGQVCVGSRENGYNMHEPNFVEKVKLPSDILKHIQVQYILYK